MATLIIGHGAILNAPLALEKVSELQSSHREGPSPVNASLARYLELHERGNLYWWRQPANTGYGTGEGISAGVRGERNDDACLSGAKKPITGEVWAKTGRTEEARAESGEA